MERIARGQRDALLRAQALRAEVPEIARWLTGRGATKVVLFGSLATGKPPHRGTDIDLAVLGMSEDEVAEALLELEPRLGAKVDLVRLETASPSMQRRIETDGVVMSEGPVHGAG